MTDPTTERMRQETGHDCPACSSAVRDLYATAHNAWGEWTASAIYGCTGSERIVRKMAELGRSASRMQEVVDGHFAAMDAWRRP